MIQQSLHCLIECGKAEEVVSSRRVARDIEEEIDGNADGFANGIAVFILDNLKLGGFDNYLVKRIKQFVEVFDLSETSVLNSMWLETGTCLEKVVLFCGFKENIIEQSAHQRWSLSSGPGFVDSICERLNGGIMLGKHSLSFASGDGKTIMEVAIDSLIAWDPSTITRKRGHFTAGCHSTRGKYLVRAFGVTGDWTYGEFDVL